MKMFINKKGFTLLEVIVAVAILAFMMILVWAVTSQSIRSKDRGEGKAQMYQQVRLAMDKITNDLSMAFLIDGPSLQGEARGGPAVKAAFKGEEQSESSSLNFAAFSHMRLFRNSHESDQSEIGYFLAPATEDEGGEGEVLMRRESSVIDDKPEEGGITQALAEGVKKFQLEYYDYEKEEWSKTWDSEGRVNQGKLPQAVKIKLVFPSPDEDGEDLEFTTTVMIQLFKEPIRL